MQRVELADAVPELHAIDVPIPHPELVEVDLVPLASERLAGSGVGLGTVERDSERVFQGLADLRRLKLGLCQPLIGIREFARDSCLFVMEEIEGNGLRVVRVEQLLLFGSQLGDALALPLDFGRVGALPIGEVGLEALPNLGDLVGLELEIGVGIADHRRFDIGYLDVRLFAAVAALPTDAEEVVIGAAMSFGASEYEPGAAACAEDSALQVVPMLAVSLRGTGVGTQDLLDSRKGFLVDQRRVAAGVLDAAVADGADVVPVLQDRGERRPDDHSGRPLAGGSSSEAPVVEFFVQPVQRVVASGVGHESPTDQRGAFGIDRNRADLSPVDDLADVEVADRGWPKRPAALGLLRRFGDDFVGQVGRIELGHAGHDAVQQLSRSGFVHLLGARHELSAGGLNGSDDLGVVETVAGQPVELVDDHVVGWIDLEVGEHLLQRGSIN